MGERQALLVNVQDDGVDHHQTVDSLIDFVCQEGGLDKAKVLAKRDDMLKSSKLVFWKFPNSNNMAWYRWPAQGHGLV